MMREHARSILAAMLCAACLAACDPGAPSPADSSFTAPALRGLALSASVINTDTVLVGDLPDPDDIVPIRLVATVGLAAASGPVRFIADVRASTGRSLPTSFSFSDDGMYPDSLAGDDHYTGIVRFNVGRVLSGLYTVHVRAVGENDLPGNEVSSTLLLTRQNLPPVLSDLQADTLVSRSSGNSLLQIRITATDPNGRGDIERVWFDSYRPDGTPSGGNPFLLFDDGNVSQHGDATAGDGVYGLLIEFSGASLGTYRFSFRATDRAQDSSNVVDHYLTVVD